MGGQAQTLHSSVTSICRLASIGMRAKIAQHDVSSLHTTCEQLDVPSIDHHGMLCEQRRKTIFTGWVRSVCQADAPSDEQSSDIRTGFGAVPLYTPLNEGFCRASMMRLTRSSLSHIKQPNFAFSSLQRCIMATTESNARKPFCRVTYPSCPGHAAYMSHDSLFTGLANPLTSRPHERRCVHRLWTAL